MKPIKSHKYQGQTHNYQIDIDPDSGIFISTGSYGGSLCAALGDGSLESDNGSAIRIDQKTFTYLEKLAEKLEATGQY